MSLPLALILVLVGLLLLLIGLDAFSAIQAAFGRLFAGDFGNGTMWLVVAGCIILAVGLIGGARQRRV